MSFGSIILYPFAWLLLTLYNIVRNYGLALILFSLIVKLVLLPFSMKSKKGMMKTSRLQPKIKELEKKYAGNKAKFNEAVQQLYKENDVKPMGGCLWSLIPFPILIALYSVIVKPLTYLMHLTQTEIDTVTSILGITDVGRYSQITIAQQIFENFETVKAAVPGVIKLDFSFFGLNLAETPSFSFLTKSSVPFTWTAFGLFLIPLISALLSWLSTKISMAVSGNPDPSGASNTKGMALMAPLMSLWIGFVMPAGLGIYWIANSVFAIIQDVALAKYYTKVLDAEDAERLARQRAVEEERERKRLEYERLKAENATTRNKNTSKKKVQKVERIEAVKREVEFEKKKIAEKGVVKPVAEDRPFSRGRAYNPDRYSNISAAVDAEAEAKAALEAEARAAEEAKRRDEEAFEKFLVTGTIEEVTVEEDAAEEVVYDDFGEAFPVGENAPEDETDKK